MQLARLDHTHVYSQQIAVYHLQVFNVQLNDFMNGNFPAVLAVKVSLSGFCYIKNESSDN